MTTKPLYKYTHDGITSVSPNKPEGDYTEMVRVIADEGKMLKLPDGTLTYCTDTTTIDGITEVADGESESESNSDVDEALDIIEGVTSNGTD